MPRSNKLFVALGAGTLVGLAIGTSLTIKIMHHLRLRPNHILHQVKQAFLAEGPIEGSWIEMKPVNYQQLNISTTAYIGGINRYEDHQMVQYEFIADASTGSILDIYPLEH